MTCIGLQRDQVPVAAPAPTATVATPATTAPVTAPTTASVPTVAGVVRPLVDEVARFVNARYIGPSEAAWQIFRFSKLHLENSQMMFFPPTSRGISSAQANGPRATQLTEYYSTNLLRAGTVLLSGVSVRSLLYHQFPEHFVWDKGGCQWNAQRRGQVEPTIGRMVAVNVSDRERFMLRLLLTLVPGAKSFPDLQTYRGVCSPNLSCGSNLNPRIL